MKLLLFGRETCEVCKSIKEKLQYFSDKHTPIPIEYFDVDSVDGLAESAYLSVPDIPTVILMKENCLDNHCTNVMPVLADSGRLS